MKKHILGAVLSMLLGSSSFASYASSFWCQVTSGPSNIGLEMTGDGFFMHSTGMVGTRDVLTGDLAFLRSGQTLNFSSSSVSVAVRINSASAVASNVTQNDCQGFAAENTATANITAVVTNNRTHTSQTISNAVITCQGFDQSTSAADQCSQ